MPPEEGLEVVDPLMPDRGVGIVEVEGKKSAGARSMGVRWNAKSTGSSGEYSADVWSAEFVASGGRVSGAHKSANRPDHNAVFLAPFRSLGHCLLCAAQRLLPCMFFTCWQHLLSRRMWRHLVRASCITQAPRSAPT